MKRAFQRLGTSAMNWAAFWLAAFASLGAISAAYAWTSLNLSDAGTGKPVTSTLMQTVMSNLVELNGKVDAISVKPGSSPESALATCKAILQSNANSGDGTYWIDPDGTNTGLKPFQVSCDMTWGGWTKVEIRSFYPFWLLTEGERTQPFVYALSASQINAIRSASTEAKQDFQCQALAIGASPSYVGWDGSVNAISASGLCWHSDNTSYVQGAGTYSAFAKLPVKEWRSTDCGDATEACQFNVSPALFR